MNTSRHLSFLDKICLGVDQVVRTLSNHPKTTNRRYPAEKIQEIPLNEADRKNSASLMRVNHAGEICAQALYHGQALTSRDEMVKKKMHEAALEEGDHLAWCKLRLDELGSHTSYLNPFWYAGSFCIGLIAGMVGDEWSLGFLAETERQVIQHLLKHLNALPQDDVKSYHILQQMEQDEAEHRDEAIKAGAKELPDLVKKGMRLTSKVMVKTAYWI